MKLIDLLVRELKCWPDDVHCMTQDSDGDLNWHNGNSTPQLNDEGVTWKCDESWMDYHKGWEISEDWKTAIVTRDQYESALAASQKVEWSGDGLPLVGCNVEYIPGMLGPTSPDDNKPIETTIIKVVAHERYPNGGNDVVVGVWMAKSGGMRSSVFSPRCLVNIRSEADKRRDAAISAMVKSTYGPNEYTYQEICELVYADIAAGKVPGVKLED